jgi:hypothetical protein
VCIVGNLATAACVLIPVGLALEEQIGARDIKRLRAVLSTTWHVRKKQALRKCEFIYGLEIAGGTQSLKAPSPGPGPTGDFLSAFPAINRSFPGLWCL